jgi:nucleoside-diphosphate-sugar epimerase
MQILLTGAHGFLGQTILSELRIFHQVFSLGRGDVSDITCDLSVTIPTLPPLNMVIHAAGKAHVVPKTEVEKNDFFNVNVQGTRNLLDALENNSALHSFVFISTVAVYGVNEGLQMDEDNPLMAEDPYGKSKIEAERMVAEWCLKRDIRFYILRLPLIAGANAPGNLGAMVKAIKNNRYLKIGNASAKKSMVLATDIASLISKIDGPSGFYNLTDGHHPSFEELENRIASHFNKKRPMKVPILLAKCIAIFGDIVGPKFPINSNKLKKITSTLTFNDSKARANINWQSSEVLKKWSIE